MDEKQPPSKMKILVIRLSSIGDIVLTTPVIRAIKEQLQDVELHFLTKKANELVVASNPHIDKIHFYTPDNLSALMKELKAEQFQVVVDLQKSHRSRQVVRRLKVPHTSFLKYNFRKWLCVCLKLNFLPDVHIVDRYFDAVLDLGVLNDHKGLEFHVPENAAFDEDDLPMVFEDGFVAVVLGGQHETKRIPVSKVVEISSILHKPIMLLGGKDVVNEGEEVVAALGGRAHNGCGKYSLYQSCSILDQADCVITGDTGLMHIAAALRKPIAVLWGNTIPEFGMYPYMPGQRELFRNFEVCPLHCRPCSKLGFQHCPRKHFKCMNNIPAEEVADWVNRF
jgi:ADP-heptose:LPS heptosyltransferase